MTRPQKKRKKKWSFKVYYKTRSNEIRERVAERVDYKEQVVWLRNGGWVRLTDAYLTRERAEWHEFEHISRTVKMPPENEK